jgi:hypothetical protein
MHVVEIFSSDLRLQWMTTKGGAWYVSRGNFSWGIKCWCQLGCTMSASMIFCKKFTPKPDLA